MDGLPLLPILILYGKRGIGKTSAILAFARLQAGLGLPLAGVACPSTRNADGRPMDILARDLSTDEEVLLASRSLAFEGPVIDGGRGQAIGGRKGPSGLPPLRFSEVGFLWARSRFLEGLASGPAILALDEFGPLELEGEEGFASLLPHIAREGRSGKKAFVLTARASLADQLQARFPEGLSALVEVDEGNRKALPEALGDWAGRWREGVLAPPRH